VFCVGCGVVKEQQHRDVYVELEWS